MEARGHFAQVPVMAEITPSPLHVSVFSAATQVLTSVGRLHVKQPANHDASGVLDITGFVDVVRLLYNAEFSSERYWRKLRSQDGREGGGRER